MFLMTSKCTSLELDLSGFLVILFTRPTKIALELSKASSIEGIPAQLHARAAWGRKKLEISIKLSIFFIYDLGYINIHNIDDLNPNLLN